MKKLAFVLVSLLASAAAGAQTPKYPPLSELGMEGKGPDEIARGIEAAYTKGELQRTDSASIATRPQRV
jgi:hypothetical protein